jgi:hypothetical protein
VGDTDAMTHHDLEPLPIGAPDERRRRSRRLWAIIVIMVVLVGAGAVAVVISDPFATHKPASSSVVDNAEQTSLSTVTRRNLFSQTQVSATLGYAGSYSVVNQTQGIVTALPSVGREVGQGQILYQVGGAPVVLLYGTTPAYRSLSASASGADVAELNGDLVALGYATSAQIPAGSDRYTWWTREAVEKLQATMGVTKTGTLGLGQVVFEPAAVRVTTISATLGTEVQPGQPLLSATSTTRQVSIALDAAQQSEVAVGDKVIITLPNNKTSPGVVSSVGTVATTPPGGGSAAITVLVNPTDPAATGAWDQAPVEVTITTGTVSNALVVPVDALLAQPVGGYAVEVVAAHGIHHMVSVSLGLFDDAEGLVQVTRTSLNVGQRIVVPKL